MKTVSRVILSAILLVLTGLMIAAAKAIPEVVFSFYPDFSSGVLGFLSKITSPFPFALWEVLVLLLVLWAIYTLVQCFRKHRGFVCWLSGVLLGFCAGLMIFVAIWGLGHFGPSVGERIGLETRPYTTQELYDAAAYYAGEANTYAAQVSRDADGVADFQSFSTLAAEAPRACQALPALWGSDEEVSTARVKRLTAWQLYSYAGVTGIFVPFTGESSVNPDTFVVSLPFTMCHEVAHRLGFPAEDDANFCAYLACSASDSIEFRYSGAYSAFVYCYNALYAVDRELAAEIWNMASEQLQADCRAANAHYEPYEGTVQDAAQKVNDTYLKAFDQEEGVQSYGAVADYLIAWYLSSRSMQAG